MARDSKSDGTAACEFGAKQFILYNCKVARRKMLIQLVCSLVDPSLRIHSGLAVNCLSAVRLLPQCECPFCFSLGISVCTLVQMCTGASVWVLQSAHLFRSVLGNQKNCAICDVYVCLSPGNTSFVLTLWSLQSS